MFPVISKLSSHLWLLLQDIGNRRSSRPVVFCKKTALKNFTKFSGKHLWSSFFFNKVAGLMSATLLKKRH